MKASQYTGCFLTAFLLVFVIALAFFAYAVKWLIVDWWVWVALAVILSQTIGLAIFGRNETPEPWKDNLPKPKKELTPLQLEIIREAAKIKANELHAEQTRPERERAAKQRKEEEEALKPYKKFLDSLK